MLRLKHAVQLGREVLGYSRTMRTWWFVPLMMLLGLVGLAMSATSATVPVAVYTLF